VTEYNDEVVLEGGNTHTAVVRIGDTVRRRRGKHSTAVHALLLHLRAQGFYFAPEFLGVDIQGREVLSYIPGDVTIDSFFWTSDKTLLGVARMLRQLHDATTNFPFDRFHWTQSHPDGAQHEVVCHGDFAPYNIVCRGEMPVGVFDFDLAGPGPRILDIAYAIYWLAPMSMAEDRMQYAELELDKSCPRAKRFCAEYGVDFDDVLLDTVADWLKNMGDKTRVTQLVGADAADRLESDGHLAHWRQEHAGFEQNIHRYRAAV